MSRMALGTGLKQAAALSLALAAMPSPSGVREEALAAQGGPSSGASVGQDPKPDPAAQLKTLLKTADLSKPESVSAVISKSLEARMDSKQFNAEVSAVAAELEKGGDLARAGLLREKFLGVAPVPTPPAPIPPAVDPKVDSVPAGAKPSGTTPAPAAPATVPVAAPIADPVQVGATFVAGLQFLREDVAPAAVSQRFSSEKQALEKMSAEQRQTAAETLVRSMVGPEQIYLDSTRLAHAVKQTNLLVAAGVFKADELKGAAQVFIEGKIKEDIAAGFTRYGSNSLNHTPTGIIATMFKINLEELRGKLYNEADKAKTEGK